MLKRLVITTALSGLMIGGAVAQSTQQGVGEAEKAAQSSPSGGAKFINAQGGDQWLSSNFIGTDVVGADNEKIGDVSDILFDKSGNIVGYVVGVGGFLGIGAKNVALAPSSFQVMPAGTGTTGTGSTAASGDEVKLKLNMTKDQLKQAVSFETKRDQEAKNRAASQPAPGGSGMNRPQSK
jgi:hypothetical protein